MASERLMEFSILGPLEARFDGEGVPLGGAKQRAVLAVLLLRQGEVVPIGRLVDEIWGDAPPPSAEQTIKSYVSRLRQQFSGRGPVLARHGAGYTLELQGAKLDASRFVELHESATLASAVSEHAHVVELAAAALALWRGPALADVTLASAGRAESERLEELRLQAYELRFDAELALGCHEQSVSELQALVAQNPYRERFVAQLMLALYRSGRHAEALDAYEQMRCRLDDDLGLQPSADLQQLSGQIVRQDASLARPVPASSAPRSVIAAPPGRRAAALAASSAVVAFALALTASGGAAVPERAATSEQRLALVVPRTAPRAAAEALETAVESLGIVYNLETQAASIDPRTSERDTGQVVARIRNGGVGLVVALGDGPATRTLAGQVRGFPESRFLFIDASLRELSLEGVPNAAAIRFADEDPMYLAGYLSGLVPTLDRESRRADKISIVAGKPTIDTARLIAGFRRGARDANRRVELRVDYSHELDDVTACERIANRQIDEGSDIVVAIAGKCGRGAAEVARTRSVWVIGAEDDGIRPPDVLFATHKEWSISAMWAIEELVTGTLPMGRDTVLGLEDDYAAGQWFSLNIPAQVESAVVKRCSELRATRHRDI